MARTLLALTLLAALLSVSANQAQEPKLQSLESTRSPASVSQALQLEQLVQVQKEKPAPLAQQAKAAGRTQIKFLRPTGMKIQIAVKGDGQWDKNVITAPGNYNFPQGATYRLKLTNIEGHPDLELFSTIEVRPANGRTREFLTHSSVPVELTNQDFTDVANGNYVVKVIYMPSAKFQGTAGTGTDEILSTRLEPGRDPVRAASQRGDVLAVIRMGNRQE